LGVACFDIADELLQSVSPVNSQPALTGILVGEDDLHSTLFGILPDDVPLVLGRVLLMFR
jgi:hypothetical protein